MKYCSEHSDDGTPDELAADAGRGGGTTSGAVMLATMSAASAWKLARTRSSGRFRNSCCSVSGGAAALAPCSGVDSKVQTVVEQKCRVMSARLQDKLTNAFSAASPLFSRTRRTIHCATAEEKTG